MKPVLIGWTVGWTDSPASPQDKRTNEVFLQIYICLFFYSKNAILPQTRSYASLCLSFSKYNIELTSICLILSIKWTHVNQLKWHPAHIIKCYSAIIKLNQSLLNWLNVYFVKSTCNKPPWSRTGSWSASISWRDCFRQSSGSRPWWLLKLFIHLNIPEERTVTGKVKSFQ